MPTTRRSTARRAVVVLAALSTFAAACTGDDDDDTADTTGATTDTIAGSDGIVAIGDTGSGGAAGILRVRLSQGASTGDQADEIALATGTELDAAAIAAVLERFTPFETGEATTSDFAWPAETLTPPRTGATVAATLQPTAGEAPDPETGPLEVVRISPTGDVAAAGFLAVTFNQPMVPVGTVEQLGDLDVPVELSPPIEGSWRWVGTRTVRFDATVDGIDRLPMATDYTVTIPAGTRSATGATLAEAVEATFATPPVSVIGLTPQDGPIGLTPVFVATFDQRVDPDAVLAEISLEADGDTRALRLATEAEIAADEAAQRAVDAAPEGRWLAFRATEALPTDADLDITVGPGVPSAEGPRTSDDAERFSSFTYAPLKVVRHQCSWGDECPPGTELQIEFNNPLDAARFDPSSITISPELPGARAGLYGTVLSIQGNTAARTTYEVTVPAGLTDTFGQQLGEADTVRFEVGDAQPYLEQLGSPMITLDPATEAGFSVRSTGHETLEVEVYEVTSADWVTYMDHVSERYSSATTPSLPKWKQLATRTVTTGNDPNSAASTLIDLSDELEGNGHVVVLVSPTERYSPDDDLWWQNQPILVWAQRTGLALDLALESDDVVAWVTDLSTGAPVGGAEVTILGTQRKVTTGADGLALATIDGSMRGAMATVGTDSVLSAVGYYGETWTPTARTAQVRWYTTDDRALYQPGETVHIKGWIRRLSPEGQLSLYGQRGDLTWTARDPQGADLASGSAELTSLGGFDLELTVPEGANLGYANVEFDAAAATGEPEMRFFHSFQIAEFRRPTFEVGVGTTTAGPFRSTDSTTVDAEATYFAGGALGAAPVSWTVSTSSASYSPPGWDRFTFGEWIPWWWEGEGPGGPRLAEECCFPGGQTEVETFTGTTDAAGHHYLQVDYAGDDGVLPDTPQSVTAEAYVTDVDLQGSTGRTSWLVHPADRYVGLRSEQAFVRAGGAMPIEVILTDIDGEAVAGQQVTVTAARQEWVFDKGSWTEQSVDPQTCTVTSGTEPVGCEFTAAVAGRYQVSSTVTGSGGGASRTQMDMWVAGADATASQRVGDEGLTIVPDRQTYEPGDTAEVLVVSPISGHGLAVVTRAGIEQTVTFEVTDGSGVVQIPLTDEQIPGVSVSVEVVGTARRVAADGTTVADGPSRPAYATGQLYLAISTASRTLDVTATPAEPQVLPGSTTSIEVAVRDDAGQPVAGSEVAVMVVDDAVLAVGGWHLNDPMSTFYGSVSSYLATVYGRSSVVLTDPDKLVESNEEGRDQAAAETEAPAEETSDEAVPSAPPTTIAASGEADGATGGAESPTPIAERTDFDPLAAFEPTVVTGADGTATVTVDLPDNLTRYRVVAIAVDGPDRFGAAESTLTARLPLMVRPSLPRFANFGDRFALPVVLQNQTDQAMTVDVVAEVDNLELVGGAGRRVEVPANDRVMVRFEGRTTSAGEARVRFAALSGSDGDAQVVTLPVYTPATAEAMATYGVLDGGAMVQPVLTPTGVEPSVGGLEVTLSSTALAGLTDAVLYVTDYPYSSADALASRITTTTALADVLDAFDVDGLPSPAEVQASLTADVAALVALQGGDGGFAVWKAGMRSDPFVSVAAARALIAARDAQITVPDGAIDAALGYLANIAQYLPSDWSPTEKARIEANALAVRARGGDRDSDRAEELWADHGDDLGIEGAALLWSLIEDRAQRDGIERLVDNSALETADAVTFSTGVRDAAAFVYTSNQRTDALMLAALLTEAPDSDLIPKVVSGLLSGRKAGRWETLWDNVEVIVALRAYFDAAEATAPAFDARLWAGDRYAATQRFEGRSTDRVEVDVPMAQLLTLPNADVVLDHTGRGRLYYRVGVRYAPDDLELEAADYGFVVERRYEAVDDPGDVVRNDDGTWTIAAGARVRVRITMVAESQRSFVALVDPLPAGLEILNPDLATTPVLPEDPEVESPDGFGIWCEWWCWGTWFEHQNLRDDRAEAFTSLLGGGTYDYSYVARATTPGVFEVPPARAEQLYAPETFGRSASTTVTIR